MATIWLFGVNGNKLILPEPPSWEEMKKFVGGYVEHVRVLDHVEADGTGIYTSMFVNEDGLRLGLPRNQAATEVYQRNVRLAFPDEPYPFRAADLAWAKRYGAAVVDLTPGDAIAKGYKDDPWIAGPAIFFEGWTTEKVSALYDPDDEDESEVG